MDPRAKPAKPAFYGNAAPPPVPLYKTAVLNATTRPRGTIPSATAATPSTPAVPKRVPLSEAPTYIPPGFPIANEKLKAMYTTYPTRMRLGTTSLMQPNYLAGNPGLVPSTSTGGVGASTSGKRTRGVAINYAELDGYHESDDDEEIEGMSASQRRKLNAAAIAATTAAASEIVVPVTPAGQAQKELETWGDGKSYLGVQPPGNLILVQRAAPTRHGIFSEDQLLDQAKRDQVLIPISLDFDVGTFKIKDSFMWNLHETLITPEAFGRILCDDLDIPSNPWTDTIARQIRDQCAEQSAVAEIEIRAKDEVERNIEKDYRVILNLDVQIGVIHLTDKVEWDLSSSLTPELFTQTLLQDLGLASSAGPLIAHALHEELHRHKKNCIDLGLLGEGYTKKSASARKLEGVWREWNEGLVFGPRVEVLSLDAIDRLEAEKDRALSRAKRDRVQSTKRRR